MFPRIICLCGSTRFIDVFNEWRKRLTLEGNIILSIELVLPQSEREDPQHANFKVKQMLDELHLRKIDLADEIFVLNVGGYIGESTAREISYTKTQGKPVKYLVEPTSPGNVSGCLNFPLRREYPSAGFQGRRTRWYYIQPANCC